jgi:glycosyltransferase involved in cell wall biosynthesis
MVVRMFDSHQAAAPLSRVIELVSRPASTPSGLSRYADTLAYYLQKRHVPFHQRSTEMPAYLRPLAYLGNLVGYDLPTFFQNYPLGGRFSQGSVHHLTSENMASLLIFQPLKPSIVTVHGFFTYLLRNDPELSIYRHPFHRFFDVLVARGLHKADHLICVSQYMKSLLIERLGIPASKITVVYEAVDHETFFPAPVADSFYARFGLSREHRYLLYVGSEQPRKNFLTLIRAFARLRVQMPDVRLLKVGRAEYERERRKALSLIHELGLQDSVHFVGHFAGELADFYRVAELFVFPSRYEGFGFPPLEAMACGTPVICSNTTSLPEVVGDAALLWDPLDEIRLFELIKVVLDNPKLQEELIQKGIKRSAKFRWDQATRETIRVYQKFAA